MVNMCSMDPIQSKHASQIHAVEMITSIRQYGSAVYVGMAAVVCHPLNN